MIGLFNDCFPPIMDGVSVAVSNYAKWLNRTRGDVCVVTPQAPYSDDSRLGYPVHRYFSVPVPMRSPYRYGLPQMDFKFQRTFNSLPFSLVHAHCPFSSGELARKMAAARHIPMVATFHSKYRTDFERVVPNKFVLDRLVANIVSFYEQADEVWIPQESVGETLREYGYKGRMEVVDNGNDFAGTPCSADLKLEAKRELEIDGDIPLLLFVGQHIWEKNVRFIIKTLSLMEKVPFRMMFVGRGYAEHDMRKMAVELGLTAPYGRSGKPKVMFCGPVYKREEMRLYYLASDLFLFPSFYDNAPLVVREAAAMHTPSVMLAGSTASAVIRPGVNGFLSINDEGSYARMLTDLLANPQVIESAGNGAASTLARSWEDIAAEVSDRYEHLIQRHASACRII